MRKHVCDIDNTRVLDSRPLVELNGFGTVKRRRKCPKCWVSTHTIEIPITEYERLLESQAFIGKLATFIKAIEEHGTDRTTV